MHELSLTWNIVELVSERAGRQRVTRVAVEVGRLTCIVPDALRFCFEVCCRDTVLEGAQLEIREIPGLGRCRECGREMELEQPYGRCTCGSLRIDCIAGNGMRIKEMEVA